jgi:FkbM family methyltransferase
VHCEVDGFAVLIPRCDVPRYAQGFEELTMAWIGETVVRGMTVLDVGAALGLFSLNLARLVGPAGRVIAIEPAPPNIRLLRRNVARNAARGGSPIEVVAAAASSRAGRRQLFLTRSSDSHAFFPHPLIAPSGRTDVRTVTIDGIAANADFLKIDVEGAELDVLAGATEIVARRTPLVVEWVPSCQVAAGRMVRELPDWLTGAGYRCRVMDETNNLETTVEDVLDAYARDDLPIHWYSNLCCVAAT